MCVQCSGCLHCDALVTDCVKRLCCTHCSHAEWDLWDKGVEVKPMRALLDRVHAEIHSIRCLDLDGINARREAETRLSALDDLLAGEGDT